MQKVSNKRHFMIKEGMKKSCLIPILTLVFCTCLRAADLSFYFDGSMSYNQSVPRPEQVLGYQVGDWHVRHDQLVNYMYKLAETSDRVQIRRIGTTHEGRALVHLTISSKANLADLEGIRTRHLDPKSDEADAPLVVNLGYSVHGNESSGANASLLVAYYLAAAQGIDELLDKTIIILDPSLNPDGLSRFAHWANMHKGRVLVRDAVHREHNEGWPNGRTNHYWFDLNRDWLLLQHPESVARVRQFHHWRPNILTDHHEMGTDSTFFFQPGIPSRQNPMTPEGNLELTRLIGTYHAEAFNRQGELYFSEQAFDDFYYGKGSTYPDVMGAIGILFEQASSRGHLQENEFGDLSFPDTIKNQVTASLSTLQAGLENRKRLLAYQKAFVPEALELARKDKVKAYVFGAPGDPVRAYEMARILTEHQIEIYALAKPVEGEWGRLESGYIVPVQQGQYRLVKSLFEEVTSFNDNTFYDVSTWHFPSLFWNTFGRLEGRTFANDLMGKRVTQPNFPAESFKAEKNRYAFFLEWDATYAARATYSLLGQGVRLRFANNSFRARTSAGEQLFAAGTVVVPMGVQTVAEQDILASLTSLAQRDGVRITATDTGLTPMGGDLGGASFKEMPKPRVLLLTGKGVTAYRAGEMWHLLDARFGIPVAMADVNTLHKINLTDYTHLLVVSGTYNGIGADGVDKIRVWIRRGGALVAMGRAVRWAVDNKFLPLEYVPTTAEDKTRGKGMVGATERHPYADFAIDSAFQQVSGILLGGDLDLSHPLAYGVTESRVALFRSHNKFLKPSSNPYATVVQYTSEPLISGYISQKNLKKAANSAAVVADALGAGSVILMLDNPNFRGITYGPGRLLINSLFFNTQIRPTR